MPTHRVDEFGNVLCKLVRDEAIRACDMNLRPDARYAVARAWKSAADRDPKSSLPFVMIPDCVDEAIFHLLRAIDEGTLRLAFISSDGTPLNLTVEGKGELAGWFVGKNGWRTTYSSERFTDEMPTAKSSS